MFWGCAKRKLGWFRGQDFGKYRHQTTPNCETRKPFLKESSALEKISILLFGRPKPHISQLKSSMSECRKTLCWPKKVEEMDIRGWCSWHDILKLHQLTWQRHKTWPHHGGHISNCRKTVFWNYGFWWFPSEKFPVNKTLPTCFLSFLNPCMLIVSWRGRSHPCLPEKTSGKPGKTKKHVKTRKSGKSIYLRKKLVKRIVNQTLIKGFHRELLKIACWNDGLFGRKPKKKRQNGSHEIKF